MTTISIILLAVCKYYELNPKDILDRTRRRFIVEKRQMFFHLSYRLTKLSYENIGAYCNKYSIKAYDHSTVMHADKMIKDLISVDPKIQMDYSNILSLVKSIDVEKDLEFPEVKENVIKLVLDSKNINDLRTRVMSYTDLIGV